jgi:hypothetical protein
VPPDGRRPHSAEDDPEWSTSDLKSGRCFVLLLYRHRLNFMSTLKIPVAK